MLRFSLGFLAGITLVYQLAELPGIAILVAMVLLAVFAFWKRWWLAGGVTAGLAWALLEASLSLQQQLPLDLEGGDQVVTVRIAGLPREEGRKVRFVATTITAAEGVPGRISLSWYRPFPTLRPGEVWRLNVRLKRPRSFANPGSFDYAGWLYQRGIDASGYVRKSQANQRLRAAGLSIDGWRMQLAAHIDSLSDRLHETGLIKALALGVRDDIPQTQWQTLIRTGTNHLLAISGLHIGLVAALGYLLARMLWRLFPALGLWLPRQRAGAMLALLPAGFYAALSGFAVPAQRALIMLSVVSAGLMFWRQLRPWSVLAMALFLVLLLDPRVVMAVGFWLSFLAVASILALNQNYRLRGWRLLIALQLVLLVALLPVTGSYFGRGSLISPLANLLAVPVVSLAVVPLVLSGVLLGTLASGPGDWLLWLADQLLQWVMVVLDTLATLPWAAFSLPVSGVIVLGFSMLAVLLLLLPRGVPGRWLFPLFLLPAITVTSGQPLTPGQFTVAVLDVGQGLATVVKTAHHTLLFDTGARFSCRSSAARSVVLPFLQQAGVDHLDVLVLSHDDNDHAGGEGDIMDGIRVGRRYVSTSRQRGRTSGQVSHCTAGEHWRWDGVDFEFLHPPPGWKSSDNNGSCVLKVSNAFFGALLPGDIEQPVEQFLLQHESEKLPSTLLVVPHHGSLTSSSSDFIARVAPEWAVFSVGYRNRFGFPKPEILSRYHELGSRLLETDRSGGVEFTFGNGSGDINVRTYRETSRHWWASGNKQTENELVDTSAEPSFL